MRMTFDKTSVGDAREAGFGTQVAERRRARIAHARTQTTDELIDIFNERALIRHATLDALGHKFATATLTRGITVNAIALHRAEAAHAAIFLEAAPLIHHHLARCLFKTRKHTAKHHGIAARDNRFDNIAAEFDSAIRDNGYTMFLCSLRTFK